MCVGLLKRRGTALIIADKILGYGEADAIKSIVKKKSAE